MESPLTSATSCGIFAWLVVAKSSKVAVEPPTQSRFPVARSNSGATSWRTRSIRSLVAWSCGLVVGTTRSTAAVPSVLGIGPTTEATPGSTVRVCTSGASAAGPSGPSGAADRSRAMISGPFTPGPNPRDRES